MIYCFQIVHHFLDLGSQPGATIHCCGPGRVYDWCHSQGLDHIIRIFCSDITQHVEIWHGRQDTLVRLEQGELLAKEIGDSELHISDEDGHLIAGRLYREMMAAAAVPTARGSL